MQLIPRLLCSVPTHVNTYLEERWLTRNRNPCVNKDLGIPDPARLVSVEPLRFFGRRVFNEALLLRDSILVRLH